jgi:hypothetical protein
VGRYESREQQGALAVDPFERIVPLFTIEVTLDQTLENWYPLMPILRMKNLLAVM